MKPGRSLMLPTWQPNAGQQLLLQFCLLSEKKAIRSFAEWSCMSSTTRNDPGSHRLLPMLW